MTVLRFLLFPFALVYWCATALRNLLYSKGIYKSSEFDLPIISVGNLSTGGTGKTPHVEYLIRLLKNDYHVATLSRGYGRKKGGFQKATLSSTSKDIGDEPLQFFSKFQPKINVFVDVKRVDGIINALRENPETDLFLLDDAYQHRAVKAGLSILLTDYHSPFYNDYLLPVGMLREQRRESNRANTIIVSKCPENLSATTQQEIANKIKPLPSQTLYFSYLKYGAIKSFNQGNAFNNLDSLINHQVLLITGIAKPKPLLKKLKEKQINYQHLKFPDHHNFSKKNISNIINIFDHINAEKKIILTTEKDAIRMKDMNEFSQLPIYFIEIEVDFIDGKEKFDKDILDYVRANKTNS